VEGFKIGSTVRCVRIQSAGGKCIEVGYVGKVTHMSTHRLAVDNMLDAKGGTICYYDAFELIKEETKQMFNIKTDPWFIRVNSEQEFKIIQDWLQENYGCCLPLSYSVEFEYLTNTLWTGQVEDAFIMYGQGDPLGTVSRKEIKLTFKTTVNSVEYPEVNSPQQIQIEALQETISKAAMQIKLLKEGN
jgi:hypothetical protein